MSIFKCKMCGGTLEVRENESVCVCDFCGTQQTIATTQDEALQGLFNRANILRMKSEFDKAESLYEKIIQTKPDEAEAYWGLILCRYGIEYVEDPKTFKRIPTCHRTSFDSVIADPDYKAALQYADLAQRAIYEAEAKEIDRLQKEILALSQKEDPYDVFICYKETDESGRRTPDSVIANDIYHQLTQEGFKVFYAAISLENKLGSAYEPCIFAALNSAKVMLVVGTKPEYFNAVWVKNEWSRYLKLMKTDRSRILIPCYRDMDAYELPEEFAHLQAQDMGKIGFINDVVRGIKKVLRKDAPAAQPAAAPVSANATAAQPLIDRGYMALEDKEWAKADDFFEQALNLDAKNGDAYLGKFLAMVKHTSLQRFLQERGDRIYIDRQCNKPKLAAFRPNENALKRIVAEYVVPGYLEEDRLLSAVTMFDAVYESEAGQIEAYIAECRSDWASYKNLLRAKQYGKPEISALLDAFFEKMNQELSFAKQKDAEIVAQKRKDYEQFVRDFQNTAEMQSAVAKKNAIEVAEIAARRAEEAERRAAEERAAKERELLEEYRTASALAAKADSLESYDKAIEAFQAISDYKDSEVQRKTLQERRDRVAKQLEKERTRRNIIVSCTVLAVAVAFVIVSILVGSKIKFKQAEELMAAGDYDAAYAVMSQLHKDDLITQSEYNRASKEMEEGDYASAAIRFGKIGEYMDAHELSFSCWRKVVGKPKTISGGRGHVLAVRQNGTVLATGGNTYKECNTGDWRNIVSVAAGNRCSVGLMQNGQVVSVGTNANHRSDVSRFSGITQIDVGGLHVLGLKKDGTVIAAGEKEQGQCDVSSWRDIVEVSAGGMFSLGLKADGTVVATGSNLYTQCVVSNWTDVVSVEAGGYFSAGLKCDGTVVVRTSVKSEFDLSSVAEWTDIIAISAGTSHLIGLKKDGTVVAAGENSNGQCNVSSWTDIVEISAGYLGTFGLSADGTITATGAYDDSSVTEEAQKALLNWNRIRIPD